jgi:hypothetical protein
LALRHYVGASRFCLHLNGTALSLKRTFLGCLLTALLFGTAFMFWTYYPHDLPLPTLEKTYSPPANSLQR